MNETRTVQPITADSLVYEVVKSHPHTVMVLARHGLHCAGCYISPFHTIADSARAYCISVEPLLRDLNHAVA
jgi:hybrid cluster-associated redox disulfide protein